MIPMHKRNYPWQGVLPCLFHYYLYAIAAEPTAPASFKKSICSRLLEGHNQLKCIVINNYLISFNNM